MKNHFTNTAQSVQVIALFFENQYGIHCAKLLDTSHHAMHGETYHLPHADFFNRTEVKKIGMVLVVHVLGRGPC